MNTLLVLVAISSFCGISSATWFPGLSSGASAARDCLWTKWTTDGRCIKRGPNFYSMKKTRSKIPARNGGKPCTGSDTGYDNCVERQYVISTFVETIAAQTRGGSGGGGGKRRGFTITPPVKNPCAKPHRDANNNLRMFGKPCETRKRRRRNAEGMIETYEEPIRESFRTKRQAPPVLSVNHRDILFMLDESGSVGSDNFKKELKMARTLAAKFCGSISIQDNRTRIGMISFDKVQHDQFDFDELFSRAQVLNRMDNNVKYTPATSGRTCLYDALGYAKDTMFTIDRGARVGRGDGYEQVVVLFTDGCANCENKGDIGTNLKNLRIKFEEKGIPFIVFFIGNIEPCEKIMENFADGSQCYQLFRALSWAEFDNMILDIGRMQCMDAWIIGPQCPT